MYGKIFASMYEGTLYGQWEAIVTMQQLIVLCDQDGIVEMTPPAIAARTSIPLEYIEKGLRILAEPDPYTRTPGNEGRRIELIDPDRPWGWRIVNHQLYRNLASEAERREKTRERVRKHREKQRDTGCNAGVTPSNASNAIQITDTDADTDARKEGRKRPIPKNFSLDDGLVAYATERGLDPADQLEAFALYHRSKGTKAADWRARFQMWCRKAVEFREKDAPKGGLGALQ